MIVLLNSTTVLLESEIDALCAVRWLATDYLSSGFMFNWVLMRVVAFQHRVNWLQLKQ